MAENSVNKLSASLGKALGSPETGEARETGQASPPAALSAAAASYYARHAELTGIPEQAVRKAWFAMSHILLGPGTKVVDMGCHDGAVTYAMAVLNPEIQFIGIDEDKKAVNRAKQNYQRANLEFRHGSITEGTGIEPELLDAIVNSFVLHEIYSRARYNDRQVSRALYYQFSLLKQDGMMFIRDYALGYPGEYVLLEMPDRITGAADIELMSETDLLIWYSENASSRDEPGCYGFFLEELPARYPQTRLYRLPYKWAYEFIIRKNDRANLKAQLHKEYAFFTERDFRKTLRGLGARALYSAPHWDEGLVDRQFDGHFRLLDEQGKQLGAPPTSFVTVAQKMGERRSLRVQERRPSQKAPGNLRITAMRNDLNGRIIDIAQRDIDITDVIPYRVTPEGRLNVFLHEALPRAIVNVVPRNGRDIDGKRWSGHMIEALAIPTEIVEAAQKGEPKETAKFAVNYLGLKPAQGCLLEDGRSYYPAPDFIDEMVKTRFLRVVERDGPAEPKMVMEDIRGFSTTGRIREISAQAVLDAITVGFLPNAHLELQLLELFKKLDLPFETWDNSPLLLEESDPEMMDTQDVMKLKADNNMVFKKVRGTAGQLRNVQSIFVDEGWVEGGISGLASRDMEFVIPEDNTLNKAVVLPLTRKAGEVLVGLQVQYMPVPQRQEGNGLTLSAPAIDLPRDITNMHQAKRYIADTFKVPPENVWKMGESYFCHSGVTPLRIFPFAVAHKGTLGNFVTGPIQFAPLKWVDRIYNNFLWSSSMMAAIPIMRVMRRMGQDSESLSLNLSLGKTIEKGAITPAILTSTAVAGAATASPPPAVEQSYIEPAKKLNMK